MRFGGQRQPGVTARLLTSGLLVGAVAGCGSDTDSADVTVVTSVYPLEWLAEEIVANTEADISVTNLTEPGLDPHDLELSPRQVGQIGDADLVFYIEGMQPAVDDAVAQQTDASDGTGSTALNVADIVELRTVDVANTGAEEGDEDPHMWLDPELFATTAEAFADQLAATVDSGAHPDAADDLTGAAEEVSAELDDIDEEYQRGLADCELRTFVVSHAAFGYLADRYDLEQISISGIEPETEPSPARMREVTDLVNDSGVSTIFTEVLVSPQVAETIAAETGVSVEVLDALEGLAEDSPGDDYPSIMRANLDALTGALDCSGS
ncbi:metal ABC transporter substrate-binding protein [Lipingzhangella sp. LS1_29]|uniref:Metal ABC transporter substrate-binding protein n=1 Tax=Lipingzhangella rawalii TaxID=2055835 RepID=A0ABU2H9L7_9ACTN|nr:metal ABC transporter substrate-binding protein [Lipingzhangella rawalii]MDS1271978.1 metal ABC transporter substrate-binding protein [Lipingzhangella rawalii]